MNIERLQRWTLALAIALIVGLSGSLAYIAVAASEQPRCASDSSANDGNDRKGGFKIGGGDDGFYYDNGGSEGFAP